MQVKLDECRASIQLIRRNVDSLLAKQPASPDSKTRLESGRVLYDAILETYRHLELVMGYAKLNNTALYKILKKWDKVTTPPLMCLGVGSK